MRTLHRRLHIEGLEDRRLLACGDAGSTCFAVIGDFGEAGQDLADVANLIHGWNPEFIITVGDNNYPDGAADTIDANVGQYFHDYIFPYTGTYGAGADVNRFFPSLGNHDWDTPGAVPYLDYFTLPGNERYYNFTWGPVEFFALDSDSDEPDGRSSSSVQGAWLQSALAASTATWKIVYFHHPAYSSGPLGPNDTMQWPFQQWGATAVLAGHEHLYERLLQDGIPYFTNGLGGHSIFSSFGVTAPGSELRYNDDFGAMRVEATSSELVFDFIARSGQVIDTYTIAAAGNFPVASIATTDATAAEFGTDPGEFVISRTGSTASPLTVEYIVSGTADEGADYLTLGSSIVIPAGIASATLTISPVDDLVPEGPESVIVRLSPSVDYNLAADYESTVTIEDDEITVPLTSFETRVSASSDDAEERASGKVSVTSGDLEMTLDSSEQTVGLRFTGVDIPAGATIASAYVQFEVDESTSDATSLTIHGHDTGSAPTFSTTSNDVTSRTLTSASVAWSPVPWTSTKAAGPDQQTSNLATVVQEIVSRSDWVSGNALALVISGTGKRVAESFDGKPESAPLLHVEYGFEGNFPPTTTGIANVTVPVGTPQSLIDLFAAFDDTEDPDAALGYSVFANTNPALFDGTVIDPLAGTLTLDYAAGVEGTADLTVRAADTQNQHVDTTFTVTVAGASTTVEVRVSAGSDDAEEKAAGNVGLTSSDLELTFDGSQQTVGLRFVGVEVPAGATITAAHVQFQVDESDTGDTSLIIHGQYSGDAATFSSTTNDITSRPMTSESVAWSPAAWNTVGEAGPAQQTPDLSPVLQEIVGHADWVGGNALALVISGSGKRVAESYNGKPAAAPLLHIEFELNAPPTATGLDQSHAYVEGDSSVALDDIVISDPDSGAIVLARLTIADPATGSLTVGTFGSTSSSYDPLTGDWEASGPESEVNAALADVAFAPAPDNDADTTITTHVEDLAGTGPADGMIVLDASGTNDPPSATNLNQSQTYAEDAAVVALDDIVVSELDLDPAPVISATLTVGDPLTGSLSTGTFGATTSSYHPATGVWTAMGTIDDVNAALAAVEFLPAAGNTATTLIATHVEDQAAAGPSDGTITLDVVANSPPTATQLNQSHAYVEDDPVVALDDIHVNDSDAGETLLARLTLSAPAAGSLTTSTFNGLTSTYNPTTGVWVAIGPQGKLNALLADVAFIPAADYDTDVNLVTHVEDLAGTGPTDGTITLAVTPVNDKPTATTLSDAFVPLGTASTVIDLFAVFDDVEDADPALVYNVPTNDNPALFDDTAIDPVAGTLTLNYADGISGTANLTVRATDTGGEFAEATFMATVTAAATTVEIRVSSGADDAEERSSGKVNLTSSDLEIVEDKGRLQTVGMRFNALPIPRGATIVSAHVQFHVDEVSTSTTALTIRGELAGDAAAFSTTPFDLTDRATTSNVAAWEPAAWNSKHEEGLDQQTTEIAPVIQEIVSLSDWNSGQSLVILINGSGSRVAESFNGESENAPLLRVEYLAGGSLTVEAETGPPASAEPLNRGDAVAVFDEAVRQLAAAGDAATAQRLSHVPWHIADLPPDVLGQASPSMVLIDRDAAGYGWFVDPTPGDSKEFSHRQGAYELIANDRSPAADRVDLLSTFIHELGHYLGFDHSDDHDAMNATLPLSTRRLPTDNRADSDDAWDGSIDGLRERSLNDFATLEHYFASQPDQRETRSNDDG